MSLAQFEARMLKLKGIKLPAVSLIGTDPAKQALVTKNPLVDTLLPEVGEDMPTDDILNDILVGIVRSFDVANTHRGNKLTVSAIRTMLNKLPYISTPAIVDNYGYSSSQARHYARACRLVIKFNYKQELENVIKQLEQHAE